MPVYSEHEPSLRLDRLETSRLARAFAISLAIHLLCFGGYKLGNQFGWWRAVHWPAWLTAVRQALNAPLKKPAQPLFAEREPPLMFVEVNPSLAVTEAPKDAKFYSDK